MDQFALGARSIGFAETSARFRITLEPLEEKARFLIQVTGQARASTVAHTRPVQVRSGSRTDFEGHAFVHYDGWEFRVPGGEVTASSEMWLGHIASRRRGLVGRLIRRIAPRSVDRKRPQALNLLRETTKARVAESFDQSLDELERELQQVIDGLAFLWNGAQRVLNGLSQDNESTAPDETHTVEAIRVAPWWVFDLRTATTRTGTAVAQEPQSGDQRARN
jgi:hypothetical protein